MDTIQYQRLEGYLRAPPRTRLKHPAQEPERCQFKRQATYHTTKGRSSGFFSGGLVTVSPSIDWRQKGNHLFFILAGCNVASLALALGMCSLNYGIKLLCTPPLRPQHQGRAEGLSLLRV